MPPHPAGCQASRLSLGRRHPPGPVRAAKCKPTSPRRPSSMRSAIGQYKRLAPRAANLRASPVGRHLRRCCAERAFCRAAGSSAGQYVAMPIGDAGDLSRVRSWITPKALKGWRERYRGPGSACHRGDSGREVVAVKGGHTVDGSVVADLLKRSATPRSRSRRTASWRHSPGRIRRRDDAGEPFGWMVWSVHTTLSSEAKSATPSLSGCWM
jgi:hypothetical protein